MSAHHRPILPRPPPEGGEPPPSKRIPLPKPKRHMRSACETCRKSKVRCTGERPACAHCNTRGLDCQYLNDNAEAQLKVLKRKHDDTQQENLIYQQKNRLYQQENLIYKELYRLLISVSEEESLDILQRLRAGKDVETTVRLAQEGDLLLQLAQKPPTRIRYQLPCLPSILPPTPYILLTIPYLESLLNDEAHQGFAQPPQQSSSVAESSRSSIFDNIYLKPHHAAALVDGRLASRQGLRLDRGDYRRQHVQTAATCVPTSRVLRGPRLPEGLLHV